MPRSAETLLAVLFASVVTAAAYQPAPTLAPPACFVRVVQTKPLHDADGVTGDLLLPFSVTLRGQTIRAQSFDAWEVDRTRQTVGYITDAEIQRGKLARDELQRLINGSRGLYAVESAEKGVYGRVSAHLYVQRQDGGMLSVAKWAADGGHVRN